MDSEKMEITPWQRYCWYFDRSLFDNHGTFRRAKPALAASKDALELITTRQKILVPKLKHRQMSVPVPPNAFRVVLSIFQNQYYGASAEATSIAGSLSLSSPRRG